MADEIREEETQAGASAEGYPDRLVDQIREVLSKEDSAEAVELLSQLHPVDKGRLFIELAKEPRRELLAALPSTETAEILEHLDPEEAVNLSASLSAVELPRVLDEVRPDVAADILKQMPSERFSEALGAMLRARGVIPLLAYSDTSAGGLMTPEYFAVRSDATSAMALDGLRIIGPRAGRINTLYAIDDEDRLVGSLSVASLALARPKSLVKEIMDTDIISVTPETDQEECARLMQWYNISQLPVVEEEQKLVGVILLEDVVDVVEEEATEDMYRMAGMAGERLLGPIGSSVRSRLPWLYVNLATAFLAAGVVALFESTIARAAVLAAFLPIIAGQGGIGGTQTLTLVVRSMALGQLSGQRALKLLSKEVLLGVIHGIALGLVVGLITLLWQGNAVLGLIVGLAMMGNMAFAGLTGAGVPLLLRRLKQDPAVSSAIFVTTFTDVMGFFMLLGIATLLIRSLL